MKIKPIDRMKEILEKESNEALIAEVLEYVKVLTAYRKYITDISKKPPSPAVWVRLPRWKQLQIILICEWAYRMYQVKTWKLRLKMGQ